MRYKFIPLLCILLVFSLTAGCNTEKAVSDLDSSNSSTGASGKESDPWKLVYHETFDSPFNEPNKWIEDTYGDDSPYHVDAFDEDGDFFIEKGGEFFLEGLKSFRSFRKSYTYGKDGWLTVELYGRDSDRDGIPETGGKFISRDGKALLVSTRHYDGAIIRSTNELPSKYRIELTVSNIDFGGEKNGSWNYNGGFNGYNGDEISDPWCFRDNRTTPFKAIDQNGVYFLCITDYPRPAPHNNVFIHHHRKVVMDTDNNNNDGSAWSYVWDPVKKTAVEDGSRYISMLWLQGDDFGSNWTGNKFTSYTPDGWKFGEIFTDKYLDGESYTFAIERNDDSYTMSVSGKFHYGGETTYKASRKFTEAPVTWHYNQTPEEYKAPYFNQIKSFNGKAYETWPEGSAYPDYFFFGDPHINFYEGTAEFDDLKLYLPR